MSGLSDFESAPEHGSTVVGAAPSTARALVALRSVTGSCPTLRSARSSRVNSRACASVTSGYTVRDRDTRTKARDQTKLASI